MVTYPSLNLLHAPCDSQYQGHWRTAPEGGLKKFRSSLSCHFDMPNFSFLKKNRKLYCTNMCCNLHSKLPIFKEVKYFSQPSNTHTYEILEALSIYFNYFYHASMSHACVTVEGHLNPGLFNPNLQPWILQPHFSTMKFSIPKFSTMKFWTTGLKSPGLKCPLTF